LQTLGVKELRSQFSNEDEALNDAIDSAKTSIETLKELRSQFVDKDEDLAKAIDLAKRTIEMLKEEDARCTESSAVGKENKRVILKAQITHHGLTRELLNAQVSKCVTLERSHDRDEETKAKLREITKLFRTNTRLLHLMCQAPPPKDLRTWLETHKLGLFAGLPVADGSVVGGLGGWALAAALYQKHFNATPPSPDAAEAQHFKKIEAMLKALKDIPFTAQDIAVIGSLYQQMFAPTSMQSGLHECLVCQCHEELRSCDDDDGDHVHSDQCVVSAPGCKHHFAHRGCYTT
jgi:DNA-binding XRE family transcriptional regulator